MQRLKRRWLICSLWFICIVLTILTLLHSKRFSASYPFQKETFALINQKWLYDFTLCERSTSDSLPVFSPEQPLIVNEANFLAVMEMLWEAPGSYLELELEMVGFIYPDPLLAPDDFVLARQVIIADLNEPQVVGLLCRYAGGIQYQPGRWLKVRGEIAKIPYYDAATRRVIEMPYLQVREILPVEKPEQEYIYP